VYCIAVNRGIQNKVQVANSKIRGFPNPTITIVQVCKRGAGCNKLYPKNNKSNCRKS